MINFLDFRFMADALKPHVREAELAKFRYVDLPWCRRGPLWSFPPGGGPNDVRSAVFGHVGPQVAVRLSAEDK